MEKEMAEKVEGATDEQWKELYGHFAKSSCRKCYGRGYVGRNAKTGKFIGCTAKGCSIHKMKIARWQQKKKEQEEMRAKLKEKEENN